MTQYDAEIFEELPPDILEADLSALQNPMDEAQPDLSEASSKTSRFSRTVIVLISFLLLILVSASAAFYSLNKSQAASNEASRRIVQGNSSIIAGDLDDALFQFTRALEADPNVKAAHSALGRIMLIRGRGDEAVRHFEAELTVNPDDQLSHLALGCLYALASIEKDDSHGIKGYIISRFVDVYPVEWNQSITFSASDGVDPLARSIYHFQSVLDLSPNDPKPGIGLALSHLAVFNLADARDRLSKLSVKIEDPVALAVVKDILQDINEEEIYLSMSPEQVSTGPDLASQGSTSLPEISLPKSTRSIAELPPMSPMDTPMIPTNPNASSGGFGNRNIYEQFEAGKGPGLKIAEKDLKPQPTVKPINNDVYVPDSGEYIPTVRLANISLPGNVGFREGETVVMPNTNIQVKVLKKTATEIVVQEGENVFRWVPSGDVGWTLAPESPPSTDTATPENTSDEKKPESSEKTDSVTEKLGPEVSN